MPAAGARAAGTAATTATARAARNLNEVYRPRGTTAYRTQEPKEGRGRTFC